MKIADVTVTRFKYMSQTVRDSDGHGHATPPGHEHEATQTLLTITTDEGISGYHFGVPNPGTIETVVKPYLTGQDPLYRELLWHGLKERQRLHLATLS